MSSRKPKPSRPRAAAAEPWPVWKIALLLAAMTLVSYAPALQAEYIWDDEAYVTGNETLRTLGGIVRIWTDPWATPQYYPLVHTTFWLEYRLWALAPAGYHLVNILLHAANATLVFLIVRRLALPGAWFAAALFALHPVHVESVAWITERKNVLSGFFYLAALLTCLRLRPPGAPDTRIDRRLYGMTLALFGAALLSKTVTSSLPAAYLLLIYWKEGRVRRRDVLLLLPFFVLGAAAGGATAWLEKHRVGAYGADWDLSFADRLLIAGRAVWFYLGKLLWPHPLIFIYPRWAPDPRSVAQWVFPASAVFVLGTLFALRHRWGRGPLVAALFFGGTLFPALGFFDIYPMRYSFVADHFQYLASLGVLVLLAALVAQVRPWPPAAAAVPLALLGLLTFHQTTHYRNYETLWLDTLAKNPECWMAYNNLGLIYEKEGRTSDAIEQYRRALAVKPDLADAHTNLGNALLAAGRRDEALGHLREAVRLAPDSGDAWNNLAGGLSETGRGDEALAAYREAVRLEPEDGRMRLNLGQALADRGALDEARDALNTAGAHIDAAYLPTLGAAHFNLGNRLFQAAKLPEAEDQYRRALRANPADVDARINLGYTFVRQGRRDEALALFREALARQPGSPRAQAGLAMIGAGPQ